MCYMYMGRGCSGTRAVQVQIEGCLRTVARELLGSGFILLPDDGRGGPVPRFLAHPLFAMEWRIEDRGRWTQLTDTNTSTLRPPEGRNTRT